MADILSNREHEGLTKENDLFNIYPKAETIKNILLHYPNDFVGNNMVALYGRWGTGKTTLIKYLIKELSQITVESVLDSDQIKYKPIFFEAWKYENDKNLPLSLLEAILENAPRSTDIKDDMKRNLLLAGKTIFNFGKNFILNTEIETFGVKLGVGKAGQDTIQEMTPNNYQTSLYSQIQKFEKEFKEIEGLLTNGNERIIVFVDDLDRCEPGNVLNLLASIKLFFTFGENILYFVGVDKNAVMAAIATKYNNVIKAEEYLEKIFDITFNIPQNIDLGEFLKRNLNCNEISKDVLFDDKLKLINDFFTYISFKNPRHIKKVFNKLELLRRYQKIAKGEGHEIAWDLENNIIQIIFALYIIILHDFNPERLKQLLRYEQKFNNYKLRVAKESNQEIPYSNNKSGIRIEDYLNRISKDIKSLGISSKTFTLLMKSHDTNVNEDCLLTLLHYMTPLEVDVYYPEVLAHSMGKIGDLKGYILQFDREGNEMQVGFCNFLVENAALFSRISLVDRLNEFKLEQFFQTIILHL